tara:strand:- start:894 stop:1646 length:753 start_codon:yes stop_codon:yes gene_type:complete
MDMQIRPNRVKRKLAAGEVACTVCGISSADDIEAFGPNDFDGIWVEGEHGAAEPAQITNITRACDIWGMTSVVRINRNDQNLIYRTLDLGAQAIVVPHVNTREEAANVVEGGKFGPIGKRGMFGGRQSYGVEDYFSVANDETLLIVLIEDIVAVQNLDEILTVDHIDVFFVAPSDLASSMGHTGEMNHPEAVEVMEGALRKIVDSGRTAGALAWNHTAEKLVDEGIRFLMTPAQGWLAEGATDFLKKARK